MEHRGALRAALALAAQSAAVFAVCALGIWLSIGLGSPVGGAVYDVVMWAAVPLAGLGSAWLAVRMGAPYWLAWIAPPLCQVGAQWALTGVLPASPGMPMVALLLAVIGSAAGEEQRKRAGRRNKR